MMLIKRKAFAYITRRDHLLIFSHPDSPEAGLQVPAGTLKEGEILAEGVLREAREETGLTQLRLGAFLGEVQRDMSDFGKAEVHQRYFYHVWCDEDAPERWMHGEFDASDDPIQRTPIRFEFFWVALPDGVPPLIADHDACLPALIRTLRLGSQEA
jgi:8-oxo-dGTP pyrophosphatase MutT (NUDIX family)